MPDTTIRERAQAALLSLNCAHPDTAIIGLRAVLARLDPHRSDAEVIARAIDRLDDIARAIVEVENMLTETEFSFGKVEKQRR